MRFERRASHPQVARSGFQDLPQVEYDLRTPE
jgi:hypothetical protein